MSLFEHINYTLFQKSLEKCTTTSRPVLSRYVKWSAGGECWCRQLSQWQRTCLCDFFPDLFGIEYSLSCLYTLSTQILFIDWLTDC